MFQGIHQTHFCQALDQCVQYKKMDLFAVIYQYEKTLQGKQNHHKQNKRGQGRVTDQEKQQNSDGAKTDDVTCVLITVLYAIYHFKAREEQAKGTAENSKQESQKNVFFFNSYVSLSYSSTINTFSSLHDYADNSDKHNML